MDSGKWCCSSYFLQCPVSFRLGNRHLKMSLWSGRIVWTKFFSTGYKMLFLSFITFTKGKRGNNQRRTVREKKVKVGTNKQNRSENKGQRKQRNDRETQKCYLYLVNYSQNWLLLFWPESLIHSTSGKLKKRNCQLSVK